MIAVIPVAHALVIASGIALLWDAHSIRSVLPRFFEGKLPDLNLGTGNGVTVLEAIHAFEKVSGVKLNYEIGPRRAGDVANDRG